MKSYKCKECGREFEGAKNLHAHLKCHKLKIQEYYEKHYPRVDLYTKKPIKFKNPEQYLSADFNRVSNFLKWCTKEPPQVVKPYLLRLVREKIEGRTNLVMGQAQLESYELPSVAFIEKLFGSFKEFCDQLGYDPQFPEKMPPEYEADCSEKTILVDTREKKPLSFKYTRKFKLDFGDYSIGGGDFSYTFVDRKSVEDFVSTVSLDFDRMDREIERCKSTGSYLFVVVEGSFDRVKKYILFKRWNEKTSYQHIMHNMRELLRKHAGHCQFVFTSGRGESELVIPKLLYCGRKVWKVDVQNYLEKEI